MDIRLSKADKVLPELTRCTRWADASAQDRFDSYVNNSNIKAALCGSTVG